MNLLEAWHTSEGVKAQTPEAWAKIVRVATQALRSEAWMNRKVEALQLPSANNPVQRVPYGLEMALRSLLALVREFQLQLAALDKVVLDLSETLAEVQLLKFIPGVGTKLDEEYIS
ncbi:hypothetical protein KIH86_18830 [Paenibacillus sp. HN-1]|uniref:hypothetical protein n=1 Tax=Paenibacillus TaxID=44249 RepID=UPI001CAA2E2A|nr:MULTISPECIES: hypothetical protein [Paenibacillus]MBY9076998.1 hypothetical protein [Paenibacillus sp. CGMCC 1.18879]MBY9086263.1 hypothetical protein [Paenibacillus sinensis]